MHKEEISSTDDKSVITEMRRTAVKNKYVSCGLHTFVSSCRIGEHVFFI
jgi:hypothetical protein